MYDEEEDWVAQDEEPNPHVTGICSGCGQEVTSVTVDFGIGPYEYWGARGVDTRYEEVSPCCESLVLTH